MRNLSLLFVLATLFTDSLARGECNEWASYQKTDGTIVDQILDIYHTPHPYSGPALQPGANLPDADLPSAYLANVDLQGAMLYDAEFPWAHLPEANLSYANLSYANFMKAVMTGANMIGANLFSASMSYIDLSQADLSGSNLVFTSLHYTDFTDANLAGANLARANLEGVNLTGTDLYGATLTDVTYIEHSYGSAYYYANTILPDGFDPGSEGWILAPYCDFTPDVACDLADINQLFNTGDLLTGVAFQSWEATDRYDLSDNDILDAADITEWLSQAATFNGHSSAYLRGDTDLDRDVDLTDYNALATNFDPIGAYGPHLWQDGNSDGDDDIDLSDYNALTANFSAIGYGVAAVPEPTGALLALLGMLLISVFGRLSVLK